MAKNSLPMKPLRVSIKDPESPRMRALNGGAAASGTLYTYPDNFRLVQRRFKIIRLHSSRCLLLSRVLATLTV